jgi:rod shape-determining protein MreC
MEFLLNRFRNLTVLLIVVLLQLLLLAYQVKSSQDVRLIRVWSVTAVTPIAKVLEVVRRNTIGLVEDYFVLINVREENRKLSSELGNLKMENHFLKSELQTAERAQALIAFKARTPSRTIPARIIGTGTGANSRVVYVDQGSAAGIMRGMAVVTPDGIVGKVLDAYPTASQVMLITDPTFRAGVTSEKNRVNGTVEGQGQNKLRVNYVENEEKVDTGEMFYTSGDDRIFPRGMPVGKATVVRTGKNFKEIYVVPTGFQNGLEEVLIVVKGEHQSIPDRSEVSTSSNVYLLDPPKAAASSTPAQSVLSTDADRLREQYKEVGAAQGHEFGEGGPGSRPPNFNLRVEAPKPAAAAPPVAKPSVPAQVAGAVAGGTAATGAVARPPASSTSVQTNPIPVAPKPKPPVATGVVSETNPTATVPPKPKPTSSTTVTGAPGSVARPPAATGIQTNPIPVAPKPKPPVATGVVSETNPTATAPPKPKPTSPITVTGAPGSYEAPVAAKPKPRPVDAPATATPSATKPVTAPPKRVTSNDTTINIITPAPKSANPAPAKPKPQQTESAPNP